MKTIWKVSRGRSGTAHAYEIPFSFRRGASLPSLCGKLESTLISEYSEEGSRCSTCERVILKRATTSGDIDV